MVGANLQEKEDFLTKQIITYLGNKRSLLEFINQGILKAKKDLKKEKISFLDLFSGSGIVARYAKIHSNFIIANDLEIYSKIINECYLSNYNEELNKTINDFYEILKKNSKIHKKGFIQNLYSPKNENNITKNDRVFYTKNNALMLDTYRQNIDKFIPDEFKRYFLAPLLYVASVHANTSGVFKGFYKNKNGIGQYGGSGENALSRIKKDMILPKPIFSNYNCEFEVFQDDANNLIKNLDMVDICYLDPPYNQHPYGSNYFMLNLIAAYKEPKNLSKISGIPNDWNRSCYNKEKLAQESLLDIIQNVKAKYVLISYNCEGFVKKDEFVKKLKKIGKVELLEQKYNTFRGSRNLKQRNIHVEEQLYIVKKPLNLFSSKL